MIGLSTIIFNMNGSFILKPNSQPRSIERRISRTPTLDGKASIVDNGYSDYDRTFVYEFKNLDETTYDLILSAIKNYSEFVLTTAEGAFFVSPQTISYNFGIVRLVLISSGAA